jgi:HPt (histidine-containing phosphotransfer) domain-containing protein
LSVALLAEIAGDDVSAFASVLHDFRGNNQADADALRRAARTQDFAAAAHWAHRLCGACSILGSTRLARASARVQEAALAEDAPDLRRCMEDFEEEMRRLEDHLDALA